MYIIIWEFRVRTGSKDEFEQAYGLHGDWVKFFQEGRGYLRTELLHDINEGCRYVTFDYWESREAYEAFRNSRQREYNTLDRRFEALTEAEQHIGSFNLS